MRFPVTDVLDQARGASERRWRLSLSASERAADEQILERQADLLEFHRKAETDLTEMVASATLQLADATDALTQVQDRLAAAEESAGAELKATREAMEQLRATIEQTASDAMRPYWGPTGGGPVHGKNRLSIGYPAITGEIRWVINNAPPNGWLVCNGQTVKVALYPELYRVIGTAFGPLNSNPGGPFFQLPSKNQLTADTVLLSSSVIAAIVRA